MITEFFTESRDVLRRERNSQNNADQASFDKSFKDSLKYVEKHKESIAYDMAGEWEEHKFRCKQYEMEQKPANRGGDNGGSVANELERGRRAEQLIELGRSYRPAAERCPEKDESNKSAQPPPDSGGKMLKTSWGHLFEIYGDKPFMVRPGEPLKNLLPDDPDRSYPDKNRNDLDIDRE